MTANGESDKKCEMESIISSTAYHPKASAKTFTSLYEPDSVYTIGGKAIEPN